MGNEVKPVGVARKVGSVVLLLGGSILLFLWVYSVVLILLLTGKPDKIFWILSLAHAGIGIGIVSVGVILWNRWRLPLAVILLILSPFTFFKFMGLRSAFVQAGGTQNLWMSQADGVMMVVSALVALTGIILLFIERRRHHQTGSAVN